MTNTRFSTPCSTELNQYEDDWVIALVSWLEVVTGIRWIRAYGNNQLPNNDQTQYGTVFIDSVFPTTPKRIDAVRTDTPRLSGEGENELCIRLEHQLDVEVTLSVYNYEVMPIQNGTKQRTGADVLLRVIDAWDGIPHLRKILNDQKVSITDDERGRINNRAELIQSAYQYSSFMTLKLVILRATSYADDRIHSFNLAVGIAPHNSLSS